MVKKILIGASVIWISGIVVGCLISYFAFKDGFEKGFSSGVEWERNIILEYVAPKCDDKCEMS